MPGDGRVSGNRSFISGGLVYRRQSKHGLLSPQSVCSHGRSLWARAVLAGFCDLKQSPAFAILAGR